MSAVVIHPSHIWARIGTNDERKHDRKHYYAIWLWHWSRDWREAEEAGDLDKLAFLARNKNTMDECL